MRRQRHRSRCHTVYNSNDIHFTLVVPPVHNPKPPSWFSGWALVDPPTRHPTCMNFRRESARHAPSRRQLRPVDLTTRTLTKLALGFLGLIYVLLQCQKSSFIQRFLDDSSERLYGFGPTDDPTYHPRISIVVVWTGEERPNYLTWFLDSIARQPDQVELVLIQRGNYHLSDLAGSFPRGSRNIKLVQMSDERCT
jgi:hypothetical protein